MSTGGRYRENAGVRRAAAVMYDSAAWIGLLSTNGTPPKLTVGREKIAKKQDWLGQHNTEKQPLMRDKCELFPIPVFGDLATLLKRFRHEKRRITTTKKQVKTQFFILCTSEQGRLHSTSSLQCYYTTVDGRR